MRDEEHIEKAFVFGGMPARNGVTTAILMQYGFTGVTDAFSGEHNFFQAFGPDCKPELLLEGLGKHYHWIVNEKAENFIGIKGFRGYAFGGGYFMECFYIGHADTVRIRT